MSNHYFDSEFGYTVVNFEGLERSVGKLVIASCENDGDTRLYLQDPNPFTNTRKRGGWWNIFTIASSPCEKGLFICRIEALRKDKESNPIFIVAPLKKVSGNLLSPSILNISRSMRALYLFGKSNLFTEELNWDEISHCRYNIVAVAEAISVYENTEAAAVQAIIDGKFSWEEVSNLLDSLYPYEEEAFAIFRDNEKMSKSYPLLAQKAKKEMELKGLIMTYYSTEMFYFFDRFLDSFDKLTSEGKIVGVFANNYEKAEAVLRYYEELHKAQKAAKKAAKKAKKASA